MILHDYLPSGNGYKARLLLKQLGIPFRRIEYDVTRGETRTLEFPAEINPNGRVPVLETGDGEPLTESDAILFYLPRARRSSRAGDWTAPGCCSGCSSRDSFHIRKTATRLNVVVAPGKKPEVRLSLA